MENYTGYFRFGAESQNKLSILDWLENNDTSGFPFDNESQNKVLNYSSQIFRNVPQAHYDFMELVLEDVTNTKYRAILILWRIIVPIIFTIIILLGTIGNLLVISVIMSHAYMRTYTHVLLMNLAIADISFLVCCVPFQAHKFHAIVWKFGDVSCKLVQFVLYVTLYATVWTLVSIAIVRYYVVTRSKKRMRLTQIRPMVIYTACMWIIIALLNIPTALFHEVKHSGNYTYCGMVDSATEVMIVTLFVMGYLVPLGIITGAYSFVLRILCSMELGTRRRTRGLHACKGILAVVICFMLAWLPYHIHALVGFYTKLPQGTTYEILRIFWYFLAYSNSVVNPLIYNYVCRDFREAFRHVLFCRNANCGFHTTLKRTPSSPVTMRTLAATKLQKAPEYSELILQE